MTDELVLTAPPADKPRRVRDDTEVIERRLATNELANKASLLYPCDEEVLASWFGKQIGWWQAHAQKLDQVIRTNWATMGGLKNPNDPRWLRVFTQVYRYQHATGEEHPSIPGTWAPNSPGVIPALRKAQHVLVCAEHGIEGVSPEDWLLLKPGVSAATPECFEALGLQGMLTNANPASWHAQCERCKENFIKSRAAEALIGWKRNNL